jgi:type 1 glutamine amidotransferase
MVTEGNNASKKILILLGGYWHDFEGFANAMRALLKEEEYSLEFTYDFESLTHLGKMNYDLLLSYTCLTEPPEGEFSDRATKFSDAQIKALVQWVQGGGALLAAHAATAIGGSDPALEELLGGAFVSHPPQLTFRAIPISAPHPITDGIMAFDVFDELYIESYHPSVVIHMVAVYEEVAYPIAWSKADGRGRVAHISLGHSKQVWELESYKRLMLQTIQWLIKN